MFAINMIPILAIIFLGFGLIIGSFLNVVIFRWNTHKSLGGRSACMSCRTTLNWYELVPLFSYIGLGGKCRSCKTVISFQYPLVELASGLIFSLLFIKFQNLFFTDTLNFSITYAYYVVMFCILLVIAVYALKHKLIPDILAFIFGLMAFGSVFLFGGGVFYPHLPVWADFYGGLIISVPFALIWLVSRGRAMGLGDAKLAVGLGLLLGTIPLLSATILAFWAGAVVGIVLLLVNKKYGRKSEIPFAPFLVLGTFLVFVFDICLLMF